MEILPYKKIMSPYEYFRTYVTYTYVIVILPPNEHVKLYIVKNLTLNYTLYCHY